MKTILLAVAFLAGLCVVRAVDYNCKFPFVMIKKSPNTQPTVAVLAMRVTRKPLVLRHSVRVKVHPPSDSRVVYSIL